MISHLFKAISVFAISVTCAQTNAHETSEKGAPKSAIQGAALELTVTVNPDEPAPVVQIPKGANVHILVQGAGDHELHLHGYDITSSGQVDSPAYFVFQAVHTGRFAIVMHGVEDLLGRKEKPIAYLEVRKP